MHRRAGSCAATLTPARALARAARHGGRRPARPRRLRRFSSRPKTMRECHFHELGTGLFHIARYRQHGCQTSSGPAYPPGITCLDGAAAGGASGGCGRRNIGGWSRNAVATLCWRAASGGEAGALDFFHSRRRRGSRSVGEPVDSPRSRNSRRQRLRLRRFSSTANWPAVTAVHAGSI